MKKAFTLIEIIFVIVILGILSAIAIPKLNSTRDDARAAKLANFISTASQEITSYVFSQKRSENDLSIMSNVISNLKAQGVATIDVNAKKAIIKAGNINDCLTLQINSSNQEENLTIIYGNSNNDTICTQVQNILSSVNNQVKLRGSYVRF